MRFSCPAEKINLLEKIGELKCLQWRGITQSFAMLLFYAIESLKRSTIGSRFLKVEDHKLLIPRAVEKREY